MKGKRSQLPTRDTEGRQLGVGSEMPQKDSLRKRVQKKSARDTEQEKECTYQTPSCSIGHGLGEDGLSGMGGQSDFRSEGPSDIGQIGLV